MKEATGTTRLRVVVAGIAGSGKTTVGRTLADRHGAIYVDGDSVHTPENIAKMSVGTPLTDEDRWPWLSALRDRLSSEDRVVVSCSALRQSYRGVLRDASDVRFIFLDVDRDVAVQRAADRPDHYMNPEMIESQLAALERPGPDETDVAVIDCNDSVEKVVGRASASLTGMESGAG